METILNLLPLTDEERSAFVAAAPEADHIFCPTPDLSFTTEVASLSTIARATAIIGNVPPHMLLGSRRLRWLQAWSAGVDAYLRPDALPGGVMLTSAVGAFGRAVSEHMLACLLALMKRLPDYRDDQRGQLWQDRGQVLSPCGNRVLLLGTGDIGGHFAALMKAMGAYTIGINRHPNNSLEFFDELHGMEELDDLLPLADVVAMSLPESPATVRIMDARRLGLMQPHAILLNAGRGSAVEQAALVQALRERRIWGAALDVTLPEPLPQDSPLWNCPELLLTPHVAGAAHMNQTVRKIVAISLENLKHYVAGEPMRNRVL